MKLARGRAMKSHCTALICFMLDTNDTGHQTHIRNCDDLLKTVVFQLLEVKRVFVLCLAIVFSYLPQYQRIISRGSSQGISPYFVLISTLFATTALANILLLQSVNGGYNCCKIGDVHGSQCFIAFASTAQAGLQWLGSVIFFIVYLIFYPRPPPDDADIPTPPHKGKRHSLSKTSLALSPQRRRSLAARPYPRLPLLMACTTLLLTILILAPTISIIFSPRIKSTAPKSLVQDWSFFTSTLSLLTATIQFLPQMHTTLRRKHHQSLSLAMLAMQIPVFVCL
ncbi:MAG: hypothetical protein Q9218_007059, partial [Villophora microphyllina]